LVNGLTTLKKKAIEEDNLLKKELAEMEKMLNIEVDKVSEEHKKSVSLDA
jgi:hypothetical protein